MPYDLTKRLVVGLSSSALFDLQDSDEIFRSQGEDIYRDYQREKQDEPLAKGVAFPFVRRLLKLNELRPEDPPVEVILLSRNDPDTGLRVMNSIEHYGLGMTRAVFLQGKSPYIYIPAFDIELFLSANYQDVRQAVLAGYPAGQILKGDITDDTDDLELRIAFDFDGVIADDEAEGIYQNSGQLADFHTHESELVNVPRNPGPLKNFLQRISDIQKLESKKENEDPTYSPMLKVSIVTARNAPSHKRVINTMRAWDISVNEAFFMGGVEKSKVLNILKPHMFFDDQKLHLKPSSSILPSVHIPFGVANEDKAS
ncbi:5'-nucleotidase [Vibrio parahaemolyticus]|uniref:5'-nucleotidase n=1 Tax=Vibrio parahaemolyticus TaxID=670 RepID=UPI00111CC88A|nr:5'-nucleotidase [Vibrio parahaemolyticus]EHV9684542.1 5'-nucleotidase [Vibrio parahaemolyticus]EIV1709795.1 5'-nucleotidase [Vibrio parahaemolyticus]EJE4706402.1 5'-nucleotidase [Vibrio parahaemolyticus]ELI5436096.1 5'-nucleotidase [Vibrio parahaemolyticus]TOI59556.1 5'-nucleotidase [Vibrio parahaemolyticus]